jgi:ATP-dependent Clp protease, protease subunit
MDMKAWYEIKAASGDKPAEVWIYDQIGEGFFAEGITAKQFCKDLAALKASAISLRINSPGGSVVDGMAIYNALERHPANITTYVDGLAASIASVIALAGDKVVMAKNGMFMIHQPYGMASGTSDDMRKVAEVLDKISANMVNIYAEASGADLDTVKAMMDAETWMTADEAVSLGFADCVDPKEAKLAALGDLATHFKHAPKITGDAASEPAPLTAEAPAPPPDGSDGDGKQAEAQVQADHDARRRRLELAEREI